MRSLQSHGIGTQSNAHSCVWSCTHPAVNTLVPLLCYHVFRNLKRSSCSNVLWNTFFLIHIPWKYKIQHFYLTGSPHQHCLKQCYFALTVTNFSDQRFNEHRPNSNQRCFHWQLAGSSTARLFGILIKPHGEKKILCATFFQSILKFSGTYPNIKWGLTLRKELCA